MYISITTNLLLWSNESSNQAIAFLLFAPSYLAMAFSIITEEQIMINSKDNQALSMHTAKNP